MIWESLLTLPYYDFLKFWALTEPAILLKKNTTRNSSHTSEDFVRNLDTYYFIMFSLSP